MGFFDELIEKANKRKYKEHYEKAEEVMSGLAILLAISFFFPRIAHTHYFDSCGSGGGC